MNDKIYVTPNQLVSTCTDRYEQETSISWMRDDDKLVINTNDNTFITKLKHVMERDPENYKCYYLKNNWDKKTGKPSAYVFEAPVKLLTLRVGNAEKRQLTEEEKLALVARLKKK